MLTASLCSTCFSYCRQKVSSLPVPLEVNARQFPVLLFSELTAGSAEQCWGRGAVNALDLQWVWGLGFPGFIYPSDKYPCIKMPVSLSPC